MTVNELKQYRSICREINELECELTAQTVTDTVVGSDTQFPFIKHAISVRGVTPEEENRSRLSKLAQLKKKRNEMEEFVYAIPDSLTRRIIEQRYIRGEYAPTWNAVAFSAGGGNTAEGVRKIASRYLKR